jgi:membrane protein required for colicin V production
MNLFDAIIIAITLILGIKGFFNGFIKEIAGLVGIVGGLFLASIYYHQAGVYINHYIFNIPNKSAIDLVGFIAVFVGFWIFAVFIGFLLSKVLKISALGVFDRILGFLFASAKFFILVAVIISLLYQVEFLKEKMQKFEKNSVVFPIMLNIGDKIIHLNPKEIENNIKNGKILKTFKGD